MTQMPAPPLAQPEAGTEQPAVEVVAVQGRSLGQIAWQRLRRDRVAMTGGIVVLLLIGVAVFATRPFGGLVALLGHPPNELHQDLVDPTTSAPIGAYGGISGDYLFGVEPGNGRDLLSRILVGAQYSLLIAFLATFLSLLIGTVAGMAAGYFGGWIDTILSRAMDIFLAFPLLLFAIALVGVIPDEGFGLRGNQLRVALLVFIIGFFNWPYIARIIRGQTLSLREREFIDAALSMGARHRQVIFREVLPNLVAPILVYATLLIPVNILFEAALSYLGVGINAPTPSWGGMLADATPVWQITPHFVYVPGFAIFVTVLSFNLFGDGLRDALDPKANR